MWECGIQRRKIVCAQARRTEPSTFQFTEHLARILTKDLIAVRQRVNNLESSVVEQELELAINLALLCRVAALKSLPVHHLQCRLYFSFDSLGSVNIFGVFQIYCTLRIIFLTVF